MWKQSSRPSMTNSLKRKHRMMITLTKTKTTKRFRDSNNNVLKQGDLLRKRQKLIIKTLNFYLIFLSKGTDQDNDEDSDDSDLDRDDDATRDNDLDELFGFESQAKKQQKLKENEEPDDGRTRLVINSDQDWLTGVKYEGWKIIDGARPDGEISEKCQENVQPLISKKLISKRLNLIMENIFNNLMKGKITEVAQPKKHGKQVKAKYAHSQFDIEFGKQLLEEIININQNPKTLSVV